MSNLTNNTSNLQSILETINNLPETISVDETLTRSGHAADAAVVGKRFEGIAEEIKAFDPTPYNLPILHLSGDTRAMSKENAVTLNYVYGDRTGTCTCKWQGSSSIAWEKKNYTIKFDNAFEAFEGWGEQKKYCLKANFIDHSHARNLVNAKLWGQIVKTRGYTTGEFDPNKITKVVGADNGLDKTNGSSIDDGTITIKTDVYDSGYLLYLGNIFPAGNYNVSVEVYNGYSLDEDPNGNFTFTYGLVGNVINKYFNTNGNRGEWAQHSFDVEFTDNNTIIGFTPYSINSDHGQSLGYKFRNIKVIPTDGQLIGDSNSGIIRLPNGGAVDGFPCVIMLNNEFHGLYTFNIPKDGWMFGMSNTNLQQAILCADTQNAACGFKAAATLTDDFDLEYVSDENNADWVLTSLNTLIDACMNSDGTDLDSTIAQYLDWQSVIDYNIFTALVGGGDMVRKNYLLATYDGVKWFFSAYDMDTTYGLNWKGIGFNSSTAYPKVFEFNHKAMELVHAYKRNELITRYRELRNTILSEDNVYLMFSNWAADIPRTLLEEDARKWPTIPSTTISNPEQILEWYRKRCIEMDKTVLGSTTNSVQYTEQFLTDEQQRQSRENIGAGNNLDEKPWEVLKSITTDEIVWAITLDGYSADKILIEVDVPPTGESVKGTGLVSVNGSHILYNEGFTDPSTTRRARIVVSIKNGYLNVDYSYSLRDNNSLDWREFQIRSTCALGIAATDIHSVMINTTGTARLPAGTVMTIKEVRSNA